MRIQNLKKKLEKEEQNYLKLEQKTNINSNDKIKKTLIITNKQLNINYDIAKEIESLNKLLNGWEIKYGKNRVKNFLTMKDKDILLIGFLGLKNTGKSFILSRLLNENVSQKEENDNLYLKYIINPKRILN